MSSSCHSHQPEGSSCHSHKNKRDYFFIISGVTLLSLYLVGFLAIDIYAPVLSMGEYVFNIINKMWWGVAVAIFFVGMLNQVPREIVTFFLGGSRGMNGLLRATMAGFLLDLCSHGILLVAMKLYERGVSLGQVMAFLIASPWNSFSLTLVLFSLVGLPLTLTFIIGSAIIAIISGAIFNILVTKKVLVANPNRSDLPEDYDVKKDLAICIKKLLTIKSVIYSIFQGAIESKMLLRWLFLGVIIAAAMKVFVSTDNMQMYFGASLFGMFMTVVVATIIEVCSEGSVPIAAEIVNSANAPGNGFVFLMTGVSTDYTEIATLRETTKSWKVSLFLPLVTMPQILILGYFINLT